MLKMSHLKTTTSVISCKLYFNEFQVAAIFVVRAK